MLVLDQVVATPAAPLKVTVLDPWTVGLVEKVVDLLRKYLATRKDPTKIYGRVFL